MARATFCASGGDGRTIEKIGSTGGFSLGLAFDGDGQLFVCDQRSAAVWRLDLATGSGALWWAEPMNCANGMALAHDGSALFVIETFDRKVSRIAIGPDGAPADRTDYATGLPGLPDGLDFDDAGSLYVSCYEPSRILRVDPRGKIDIYIEDATAHVLCHPTNIAFDGATLYAANLGRWHITRIATDTAAAPLVSRASGNAERTRLAQRASRWKRHREKRSGVAIQGP